MEISESLVYEIDPTEVVSWINKQLQKKSMNQIAKELNMSRIMLDRFLDGNNRFKGKTLIAIRNAWEIDDKALIKRLSIKQAGFHVNFRSSNENPKIKTEPIDDSMIEVPIYDVYAAAGNGFANYDTSINNKILFPKSYLLRLCRNLDKLQGIYIEGDSMEPTLKDGDLVVVEPYDGNFRPGIYIVNLSGDLVIKRVIKMPNNQLKLISDNPVYPSFNVKFNEPNFLVAKVVIKCQSL